MLVTGKQILSRANKGKYAVVAFNTVNMESTQTIAAAAVKMKAPVMICTTEGAIDYAGIDFLYKIVTTAAKVNSIPICLHLDHGKDFNVIKKAVQLGYGSVMIDASHYDFKENIRRTKKVVSMAHKKGVQVEAELGTIGGVEDKVSARKIIYTDPSVAKEFVEKTGCDSLAVAIGTSHGAYKFAGSSRLKIDLLRTLKKQLKMPLVLHGASGIPQDVVRQIKKYGGDVGGARGVSDHELAKAVRNGINKVNTDSDLRLAFDAGIRKFLKENPKVFDPRKILTGGKALMQKVAEHRIKVTGSTGKARK